MNPQLSQKPRKISKRTKVDVKIILFVQGPEGSWPNKSFLGLKIPIWKPWAASLRCFPVLYPVLLKLYIFLWFKSQGMYLLSVFYCPLPFLPRSISCVSIFSVTPMLQSKLSTACGARDGRNRVSPGLCRTILTDSPYQCLPCSCGSTYWNQDNGDISNWLPKTI